MRRQLGQHCFRHPRAQQHFHVGMNLLVCDGCEQEKREAELLAPFRVIHPADADGIPIAAGGAIEYPENES